MFVEGYVSALPEGLATTPPGPALAAVIASVEVAALRSGDREALLAAQAKLVAHEQAVMLQMLLDTARSEFADLDRPAQQLLESPKDPDMPGLSRFAPDPVAFTLSWSRRATLRQLGFAGDIIERLPMVYDALLAGRIDSVKAWVISDRLEDVDDETARRIAASLMGVAGQLTAAQLGARIRYRLLKIDPELAKKRYQKGVADRQVNLHRNDDTTATLGGSNLPPDRAVAAYNHIDALARAARRDGDQRTLPQLRADTFLDILAGTMVGIRPGWDEVTKTADLVSADGEPPEDAGQEGAPIGIAVFGDPLPPGSVRIPGEQLDPDLRDPVDPTDPSEDTPIGLAFFGDGDELWDLFPAEPPTPTQPTAAHSTVQPAAAESTGTEPACTEPASSDVAAGEPEQPQGAAPAVKGKPKQARQAGQPVDGQPVLDGIVLPPGTYRCTCGGCTCGGVRLRPRRRATVDIHMTLQTLVGLSNDPALIPGYGPVLADVGRQVALDEEINPAWRWTVTDEQGNVLHHGYTTRRPPAAERAFVRARDRTCRAPGCDVPAGRCEQDHRREWAKGGASHRGELASECDPHHVMKHRHGFVIHHITAATYMWENPNGRLYLVTSAGDLILTAENLDPPPPVGYVRGELGTEDEDEEGPEPDPAGDLTLPEPHRCDCTPIIIDDVSLLHPSRFIEAASLLDDSDRINDPGLGEAPDRQDDPGGT